ncbi:MAG: 6-bladed beta-propeller [Tannerellaceae bacterium]|jgi:hypothetical protein|nr:6-bladed beta-propeller [Tannerellaceae bacterium]
MKNINLIPAIILLIATGCAGNRQQTDGVITVDVTKSYPKKELVLQDFLDVEYIPLETTDEFICEGIPLAIGNDIILVRDSKGDRVLTVFDRNGKGIRKINRYGESGEEYIYSYNSILDEENGEIIICDFNKILVYDLEGNFKRSFDKKKDAALQDLINYDEESFIWRNNSFDFNENAVEMSSFFITSKQDGSTLREIAIPMEERKSSVIMWRDGEITYSMSPRNKTIIPYGEEMILTEASSDTVYRYTHDHRLIPFLSRTPSLYGMDPEVYLLPGVVSDRYCFVEVHTKERDSQDVSLMLDRQTGEIFRCNVYNGDYTTKERVNMYSNGKHGNPGIAFCQYMEAYELVAAYEKGQLKGKLKEIAATLDEDDNPVIMLAKYR